MQDVKPESANADFVDALIVGVDMLASVEAKKGVSTNMRLFLVTDAGGSVNSANLDEITKKMNELQISLNVVGVDFEDVQKVTKVDEESKAEDGIKVKKEEEMTEEEKQVKVKEELASQSAKYFSTPKKDGSVAAKDPKKARKLLNESTLRDICSAIEKSTTVPVGEALDIMHYFQTKSVTSTPNFRGFLEIGTVVKIPVWTYLKTKEDGFPRLVAISKRSSESHGDRVATMEAPVGGVGRRERGRRRRSKRRQCFGAHCDPNDGSGDPKDLRSDGQSRRRDFERTSRAWIQIRKDLGDFGEKRRDRAIHFRGVPQGDWVYCSRFSAETLLYFQYGARGAVFWRFRGGAGYRCPV